LTLDASVLAHVSSLDPYVPGKPISHVARELGLDPARIIKLASNENALGCSAAARRALAEAALQANRYPDMECLELREALAARLDLPIDQIIVGAGSSELILLAAQALLAPGRAVVMPQYSFVSYEGAARAMGARAIMVPNKDWHPDLDGLLAAVDQNVTMVFIASPNNPTGVLVEPQLLERFIARVPDHVLVVLDQAYQDFVPRDQHVDARALVKRHPNVLVMRTFSKVYGLAGLRVGYGFGDAKLISLLRRLQPPFSVNVPAQATALAALSDNEFYKKSVEANAAGRAALKEQLNELRVEYVPSAGNFILMRVGEGAAIFKAMLRKGIVVRPVSNYGLPEWIRVTVGLPEENAAFVRALRDLLPAGTPR
jgi:histidinol-phosphate aminotransferase